jgi:hypothetical protein
MSVAQSSRGAPTTGTTSFADGKRGQSTITAQTTAATRSAIESIPATSRTRAVGVNLSMTLLPRTATMIPPPPMIVAAFWSASFTISWRLPCV